MYFKLNLTQFLNATGNLTDPQTAILSELFNFIIYGDETTNADPPFPPIDPKLFEEVKIVYRVAGTYKVPEGKFSSGYGNVAIIDCHYLLDNFVKSVEIALKVYRWEIPKDQYDKIIHRLNQALDYIEKYQLNACSYSLMMKGILND